MPLVSGVCNRVVVPGLLRSGPNEAPITWLGIFGEICYFWSMVDARVLIAGSVPIDVVEHAHDGEHVWKICRRGTPARKCDELLDLFKKKAIMNYHGVFDSTSCVMTSTTMIGLVSKVTRGWHNMMELYRTLSRVLQNVEWFSSRSGT